MCVRRVQQHSAQQRPFFFTRIQFFFMRIHARTHIPARARTHTHTHTQAHMTHMHAHMHRHTDRDRQNSQVCISHLTTKKMYY